MSFAESEHPRATDGTFTEKTGGAPEVALAPTFPTDYPADGTVAEQIAWALRTDAEVTLHDGGEFVDPSDPDENSLGLQDSARVYRLGGRD